MNDMLEFALYLLGISTCLFLYVKMIDIIITRHQSNKLMKMEETKYEMQKMLMSKPQDNGIKVKKKEGK